MGKNSPYVIIVIYWVLLWLWSLKICYVVVLLSCRRDICNFLSLARCFSVSKLYVTECRNGFHIIKFAPIFKIVMSISEIVKHLVSICEKFGKSVGSEKVKNAHAKTEIYIREEKSKWQVRIRLKLSKNKSKIEQK